MPIPTVSGVDAVRHGAMSSRNSAARVSRETSLAIGDAWQGPLFTTSWETCGIASQHPADVYCVDVIPLSEKIAHTSCKRCSRSAPVKDIVPSTCCWLSEESIIVL